MAIALLQAVAAGGEPAGPAHALDLAGRPFDPLDQPDARLTVLLFVRTDCPIANRYAPEIRRLQEKFAARGVVFWLVYPDPDESAERIREHMEEYGYAFGALRDPRHALVRATEASITPEAAVFTSDRRMVYRGRIDDRFVDFGKARPRPTTRDLDAALAEALDGKAVSRPRAKAVGCFIPEP